MWEQLTLPHASILEPEHRRRARLLSSLLLILALMGMVSILLTLWVHNSISNILLGSISGMVMVTAYGFSRTKHYLIAAALTIVTIFVTVLSVSIINHDPEYLYFLILCMVMSGLYLSPRATILVSATTVIAILLLPMAMSILPFSMSVINQAFLVGMAGFLATLAASKQMQDIRLIEQQSRELADGLAELTRSREALKQSQARLHLQEEALSSSEVRYRSLFDRIPAALYRTSPQGRILDANPAMVKLLGYPDREKLLEINLSQVYVSLEERARETALLEREDTVHGYQLQLYRYDGNPIWIRDTSRIVRDAGGKVLYYEGSLEDITEQIQAEAQVRSNTARTQSLAEIAQSIVEAGLNYQAILDLVTQRVAGLIGDACTITLLTDEERQLHLASLYHPQPEAMDLLRKIITSMQLRIGEGLPRRVVQSGQPLLMAEVSQEKLQAAIPPEYKPYLERYGMHSVLIVPLRAQDRVIGTLGVSRDQPGRPYNNVDQAFLQEIADRTALAIANAQLFEKAQRIVSKVQSLRQIDIAITGSIDLRISLGVILDQVITQIGVDAANVLVLNPKTLTLEFAAGRGFRTNALEHTHLRMFEGYAGRAALERRTLTIPDLANRRTDFLRSPAFIMEAFVSYAAVPLIAKGQVKGVLEIFQRRSLDPGAEWLEFLEALAGQAAIAIDNASLFADLQRSNQELTLAYDATIEGWSHALDLRDKETEGHSKRVTEMTLRLARAMAISEAELVHMRRGALLHDIGKMGIPDNILLKPDRLNEEEWTIMQKHTEYAYKMLALVSHLKPALEIPYCHHEKWDGTGYPRGLRGKEIPIAARIFAVVDVWDALRSDRPYRRAWAEPKVLEYIRTQSGQHFDPEVVEIFLQVKPWMN